MEAFLAESKRFPFFISMDIPIWQNLSLENLTYEFDGKIYIEEWKDVKDYEDLYQISSFGRVKSFLYKKKTGRIRVLCLDKMGYCIIVLCKKGINRTHRIHKLVSGVFLENVNNYPIVMHADDIKTNNFFLNLSWGTISKNSKDAFITGTNPAIGENHSKSYLKNEDVLAILKSTLKYKELAAKYNTTVYTVERIKNGITWSHLTKVRYNPKNVPLISTDIVLAIFNSNLRIIELEKKYNIPRYTICNIKKGKRYSSITGKIFKSSRKGNKV